MNDFKRPANALTDEEIFALYYAHDALELEAKANAIVRSRVRKAEEKLERIEALHKGTHHCQGGYWTDDPSYRGSIAEHGPCPTLAALRAES